jgi:hypothetical protein
MEAFRTIAAHPDDAGNVGDAIQFSSGRQIAASLGLTHHQHQLGIGFPADAVHGAGNAFSANGTVELDVFSCPQTVSLDAPL